MVEDNDFERWMKISEWRGKTVQALEDINKELSEIKEELKGNNNKIDILSNKLSDAQLKLNIKVAAIGGTTGLVVSLLLFVLTGM